MNCEHIAAILDDGEITDLSGSERAEVDTHLQHCAQCHTDWHIHAQLTARTIPPVSDNLAARIFRSLPAGAVAGAGRRTVIVPLLALASAAAAALALLTTLGPEQDAEPPVTIEVESSIMPAAEADSVISGTGEVDTGPAHPEAAEVATGQAVHRLVIWPIQYQDDDMASAPIAEAAHHAVVRFFRAQANLDVVEATQAQYQAQNEDAQAVMRDGLSPGQTIAFRTINTVSSLAPTQAWALELGAEYGIQVTTNSVGESGYVHIDVAAVGPGIGGSTGTGIESGGDNPADALSQVESVATNLARRAYAELFPDTGDALIEAVIMDFARSDDERLNALRSQLLQPSWLIPEGSTQLARISPAALEAAIELGRSAASADTRMRVWELLGQTGDPILTQSLTDALLYDADDRVRAVATDYLVAFRADPAVRAVLESVAADATSPDLLLRARWSALDDAARVSYVNATLLDPGLSPEQQMAPVILARTGRLGTSGSDRRNAEIPALEGDALDAVARITPNLHDQAIRRAALFELGYAGHPDFVSLMFDGTDASLRRSVVIALSNRRETPGVSERIDQVLEAEPDTEARQTMEDFLSPRDWFSPPGSPFQPPTAQ
jgi:hypothetical protein